MVIHNLDFMSIAGIPAEANPPLIVNPDAVLAGAVSSQFLQSIPWRDTKIAESLRCVQHPKLPERHTLDVRSKLPDGLTPKEPFRIPIAKAFDHTSA